MDAVGTNIEEHDGENEVGVSASKLNDEKDSVSEDEEKQASQPRMENDDRAHRARHHFTRRDMRELCWPHGLTKQAIPLALTLLALLFTGYGSWSCDYFGGADIGFTGGNYGLWTIEDASGKCQLWPVLFFSYNLDPALIGARVLSMSAMVLGLALATTMTSAMQYHIVTWGIGVVFFVMFLVSVTATKIFNVWVAFWLLTYIIYVLIVRALFIHPVHRRISPQGSNVIAGCFILCMLLTILTLCVLKSEYCACTSLSVGELEGRITGDPCESECRLHLSGYIMILGSLFWLLAAIATQRIGVQPEEIHENPTKTPSMYGGFVQKSVAARTKDFARRTMSSFDYSGGRRVSEVNDDESTAQQLPKRSCCQKLCCDFRVTPRNRTEKCLFWTFRVSLVFLFGVYAFIIVLLIGSRVENANAERAPDTTPNFVLDPVCAFNPLDEGSPFTTFPDAISAKEAGWTVAHCGPCSFCSNWHDIETYVETRKTIASSAKKCGPISILGSYDDLMDCLDDRIGFTEDCNRCWADNVRNTGKKCIFTCMMTLFNGFMANNNIPGAGEEGWLNHCLQCDEKMSGNAFVTCSGVARRRLGIQSEIDRNPKEQCKTVDVDWVTYFNQGES